MTQQPFSAWFTTYPETHAKAGQTVEVVPRVLLAEAMDRLAGQTGTVELEEIRERAAIVVEHVCAELESGDPVRETLAAQLRATVLQLMEMATR